MMRRILCALAALALGAPAGAFAQAVDLGAPPMPSTSAGVAAAVSDETGSGALVFGTSPTLTTPNIGAATGTALTVTSSLGVGSTFLSQDATDVFAQRRGTNPQCLRIYNTYTDASNYERVGLCWSGNIVTFATEAAGTGTGRSAAIGSPAGSFKIAGVNTSAGLYQFINGPNSTGGVVGVSILGNYTASSSQVVVSITPSIAQTSTAGYTALLVNPTESTTGSGSKLLADFQLNGVSKASISSTGAAVVNSLTSTNQIVSNSTFRSNAYTVAALPSCSAGQDGARAFVTDATATTFASAVAGGGSNHVPVYCDGSGTPAWKVG